MKKIGVIAICKKNDFEWLSRLQFSYVDSVEKSWAIAYIIPCNSLNLDHFILEMDGFILPGADEDICPSLYGQDNKWAKDCILENDKFLLNVLGRVFHASKPIIGICKWHQIINTYFGWTLNQHMDDDGKHLDVSKYGEVVHDVDIIKDSFLYEAFWQDILWVNSAHHQCVDILWKDLKVTAKSTDGFIESIEHINKPIYGFQWHPERMSDHLPIFKKFIEKI